MTAFKRTYPADAVRGLADRLMDRDWNLTDDEAVAEARDIVIDVTLAVDKLRARESDEPPFLLREN